MKISNPCEQPRRRRIKRMDLSSGCRTLVAHTAAARRRRKVTFRKTHLRTLVFRELETIENKFVRRLSAPEIGEKNSRAPPVREKFAPTPRRRHGSATQRRRPSDEIRRRGTRRRTFLIGSERKTSHGAQLRTRATRRPQRGHR